MVELLPHDVLFFVRTRRPAFALTFDDGPSRQTTPQLLDVLRKHRARATFFIIGERIRGNEALVERIVAEGHELANHLMDDQPSVRLSDREFRRQLAQVSSLLAPYGDVKWFRPGSGWFTGQMVRSAAELGLRCVLGTIPAAHYGGPARLARSLARRVRPGSIVILHEGTAGRRGVAPTTDLLLAELTRRGIAAETVSDLVAAGS